LLLQLNKFEEVRVRRPRWCSMHTDMDAPAIKQPSAATSDHPDCCCTPSLITACVAGAAFAGHLGRTGAVVRAHDGRLQHVIGGKVGPSDSP
jgi:hypothetical protein